MNFYQKQCNNGYLSDMMMIYDFFCFKDDKYVSWL